MELWKCLPRIHLFCCQLRLELFMLWCAKIVGPPDRPFFEIFTTNATFQENVTFANLYRDLAPTQRHAELHVELHAELQELHGSRCTEHCTAAIALHSALNKVLHIQYIAHLYLKQRQHHKLECTLVP